MKTLKRILKQINPYTVLYMITFYVTILSIQSLLVWFSGYLIIKLLLGFKFISFWQTIPFTIWLNIVHQVFNKINGGKFMNNV